MADEQAAVPKEKGVAAEDSEIGSTEAQALCEAGPVPDSLRDSEGGGVGLQSSRLSDERLNSPDLSQCLKHTTSS